MHAWTIKFKPEETFEFEFVICYLSVFCTTDRHRERERERERENHFALYINGWELLSHYYLSHSFGILHHFLVYVVNIYIYIVWFISFAFLLLLLSLSLFHSVSLCCSELVDNKKMPLGHTRCLAQTQRDTHTLLVTIGKRWHDWLACL